MEYVRDACIYPLKALMTSFQAIQGHEDRKYKLRVSVLGDRHMFQVIFEKKHTKWHYIFNEPIVQKLRVVEIIKYRVY